MKAWNVIDTYEDKKGTTWTLERHFDTHYNCYDGKYRIKWGKQVHRQFVGCNGQNRVNAEHYFNVTVKSLF